MNWVSNTRFVHDGKFISSSGVSASLPTALYVIELLAGRPRALEVARAQGLGDYSAVHNSDAFHVGAHEYWIGATNMIFGWPRDAYVLESAPGVDEVGLAFAVDMLSRTYRSRILAIAPKPEITSRHGLRVLRTTAAEVVPAGAVSVRIGGAARGDGLTVSEGARAPATRSPISRSDTASRCRRLWRCSSVSGIRGSVRNRAAAPPPHTSGYQFSANGRSSTSKDHAERS